MSFPRITEDADFRARMEARERRVLAVPDKEYAAAKLYVEALVPLPSAEWTWERGSSIVKAAFGRLNVFYWLSHDLYMRPMWKFDRAELADGTEAEQNVFPKGRWTR